MRWESALYIGRLVVEADGLGVPFWWVDASRDKPFAGWVLRIERC